ncbi:hypothetical protein V8F06_010552 [Rhypophila decipiens]
MQFSTITAFLTLAMAGTGLAVPVDAQAIPAEALEARAPAQLIDLWGDANFLGLKYTGTAERGACINLPSNFASIITSGKARSGLKCTTWINTGCTGTGFSFISSAKFDSWIDNKSKSWKCIAL